MAHFLRIWKDSILIRGFITGEEVRDFDQNTYRAINGDDGGEWTPSSPIVIDGEGMIAAGKGWILDSAGAVAETGPDAPIEFDKGDETDYFGFDATNTARSPICVTHLAHPIVNSPYGYNGFNRRTNPRWNIVQSDSAVVINPSTTSSEAIRYVCPINVYNGGTFSTAVLKFAVGQLHTNVPEFLPQMRLIAVSKAGDEIIPLRLVTSVKTDSEGFQSIANPASGPLWNIGNAEQSFTYSCTSNHIADIAKYNYFIEIVEEHGANKFSVDQGNAYLSLTTTFTNVIVLDGRN